MTAMNQEDFTAALNNKLDEARASLNKDFFKKFASGQLQMESMKGYVGIVYHECQYFLRLISLIHAKAERKKAREILGANLCEEYANGDIENNHPALQLKFAASLGLDPVAIEQMERPKIYEEYFADYWNLAENSFIEGLAMLSFHEHDLTKRFIRMRDALLEHYGASRDDLQYYEEHISEDSPITDPEFPGYGGGRSACRAAGASTGHERHHRRRAAERSQCHRHRCSGTHQAQHCTRCSVRSHYRAGHNAHPRAAKRTRLTDLFFTSKWLESDLGSSYFFVL